MAITLTVVMYPVPERVESFQDFFDQVGHETTYASTYLFEITILSLNDVTIRHTTAMNRTYKNWVLSGAN